MMRAAFVGSCLEELNGRALQAQLDGRLPEAEALYGILFRSAEENLGHYHGELPRILVRAADVAMQQRNYAGSCRYAERALQVLDEIADPGNGAADRETRLRALNLFAASARMQGRLQDAELTLQIALMEAEFSLGEDHPEVAAAWAELALVYIALNQPQEADRVWLKAMEATSRARIGAMSWPAYCAYNPVAA